jgi:hypothetical protein
MKVVKRFISDESGNVETGLILIPVMILFLSVLQLPISTLARIAYSARLQSDTYIQSFVGTPGNIFINPTQKIGSNSYEGPTQMMPMPGGGNLVIKNRNINLPPVTPLLINGDNFGATGISIDENY